ncbi:MAG: PAS domain-containing sensor histidine kinase [Candidatus Lokiarchaeota archaeon]|nr:PAS domain-containing sensor histidine kinase [Candidatus Lokiarchaeota archaeon]
MSNEELMAKNKELEEKLQERNKVLRDLEEKFKTIAENSLMGIAIIQDNKIKYVNKQSTDLTGYTVDETKELNPIKIFESIHPKDRIWVLEQLQKKQSGVKDYLTNYQYRIINKSGEIRWLDNYSKTVDYMGKPADMVSFIDITERKNAEQRLRESEEMFRTIAEYSDIGITVIQDEKIQYANEAMSRINGYTIQEMMDWELTELVEHVYIEDREKAKNRLKGRLTGKLNVPIASIYKITTKGGDIKLIETYSKTITYQNKFADLALIIDATYQRKSQNKLKESEEKYRSLFENMNTAFAYHEVVVDKNNKPIDYRYIEANPQFEEMTGLKVSEIIGKTVTETLPGIENDPADWIGKFGKIGLTGEPLTVEDYSKELDRWYKVSGYSPKKGYFAVTFNDITDIKRAEIKIKESEEKYRHLYENSPFSIVLLDYEGKIIDMNTKTTEIFGYKKEDIIDKNYLTLAGIFPKETIPGLRLAQDLISKGDPSNPVMKPQITEIFNKEKKLKWVESELSRIKIGGVLMIQAIIQDITEKKFAEEKLKESERILRQQNIELKELDRLKTDFISIAAHDLKTPLISVGGFIDLILLREKELKKEVKEDLNRVLNNVKRLERYINRLLDVMKIEAKKVELVKREESIHNIINNCLSDLEFQIGQKNLTINLDVSENLKLIVDHFRISQIFLNLLSNAVKFTPKDGKIDISLIEDDQSVVFSIKDNGKGLTPEEMQKIFGKFVTIEQGVDGYSTIDKGSGLGLYIAKGFIEAHGGKIWVESKGRDLGTEFSFVLPKQ